MSSFGTGGLKEATLGEGDNFSLDVVDVYPGGHQGYNLGISRTEVETGCGQPGKGKGLEM